MPTRGGLCGWNPQIGNHKNHQDHKGGLWIGHYECDYEMAFGVLTNSSPTVRDTEGYSCRQILIEAVRFYGICPELEQKGVPYHVFRAPAVE